MPGELGSIGSVADRCRRRLSPPIFRMRTAGIVRDKRQVIEPVRVRASARYPIKPEIAEGAGKPDHQNGRLLRKIAIQQQAIPL
jgi:hypothetical protein